MNLTARWFFPTLEARKPLAAPKSYKLTPMPQLSDLVAARQAKTAQIWNLQNEVVLIGCGNPIGLPGGADQCYDFRPHTEYHWLTGENRPGSVLAFDPQEGWTRFTPAVTEMERVWDGISEEPAGPYLEDLTPWLEARKGRKIGFLGSITQDVPVDQDLTDQLRQGLFRARRPKDDHELDLMHKAMLATKAGHEAAAAFIQPGVTERQIQIELEAAFARAGADRPGYHSIVGAGPNSVVFHFTPSARQVAPGDLVLIDAGACVQEYIIDVTRTYPSTGAFTAEQQAIYDILLEAERKACDRCLPGQEWLEFHTLCALDLAAGLKDLGILKGSPESAIQSEAIAVFLPHGIGHMVGLGVRDASGAAPGRSGENRASGIRVRCDLPLEPGFVMTVEPGLYFIPALINDPARREKFAHEIDWETVDRYRDFGGMRIEDNVLITETQPINLTIDIPV